MSKHFFFYLYWMSWKKKPRVPAIQTHKSVSGGDRCLRLILSEGDCQSLCVVANLAACLRLNSYDSDELSAVPIITAVSSNLLGRRPDMLQTCTGIPVADLRAAHAICHGLATRNFYERADFVHVSLNAILPQMWRTSFTAKRSNTF